MRHLMSPLDFNVDELDKILDLAADIDDCSDIVSINNFCTFLFF